MRYIHILSDPPGYTLLCLFSFFFHKLPHFQAWKSQVFDVIIKRLIEADKKPPGSFFSFSRQVVAFCCAIFVKFNTLIYNSYREMHKPKLILFHAYDHDENLNFLPMKYFRIPTCLSNAVKKLFNITETLDSIHSVLLICALPIIS